MRQFVLRTVTLAILILICPASGWSGEMRVLDFTTAGSTSRCIGDPRTSLCAAETLEACRTRSEWALCAPIEHDYTVYGKWVPAGISFLYSYRYEIMSSKPLEARDIAYQRLGRLAKPWRIGDVALQLWWEGCPPIDECVVETRMHPTKKFGEGCRSFAYCGREPHPRTYILRRKGSLWVVIADYTDPVFPESYLNRN